MQKLQLSIPEPCHENWQLMTPAEKGKFCGACQKNVFDFTKATDREIIQAYNNDQNLCGRFLNTQLKRELTVPKEKKSIWLASVFFGMISLANTKTIAQEKPNTEQTQTKHLLGKPAPPSIENGKKTITGIVSDSSGPLPGVTVSVKGTQKDVSTGFDGKYSITAKEGEILIFSLMGIEEVSKIIGSSNIIDAKLNDTSKILGEIVVGFPSSYRYAKNHAMRNSIHKIEQHTFLGRQFHKIGNLFRKNE